MKASIKDLTSELPDFEDLLKLQDFLKDLNIEKLTLESVIKTREAEIVKICMTDEKYFVGGKPPSVSFVESTYKYTGLNDELLPNRVKLGTVNAEIESIKGKIYVYNTFFEIWRTLSANERYTGV